MPMRKKSNSRGGDVYSWGSGEMGQLGFPSLDNLPKDQDGLEKFKNTFVSFLNDERVFISKFVI